MRALQGNLQGIALRSRFMDVALEYLAAHNKQQWIHTPHIITLRSPGDERFVLEAGDADERRAHRRNLLIEMRERIPEVITGLQARPFSVLPDTIQRLGLKDCFYRFGAQLQPAAIQSLERMDDLRYCSFREVGLHDLSSTMHLRLAA